MTQAIIGTPVDVLSIRDLKSVFTRHKARKPVSSRDSDLAKKLHSLSLIVKSGHIKLDNVRHMKTLSRILKQVCIERKPRVFFIPITI